MKILATGLSGRVGSRIKEVLNHECEVEDFNAFERIRIQDSDAVSQRITSSDAQYVLHLAAKADPDECEKDKSEIEKLRNKEINSDNSINVTSINSSDWKESNSAFAVNVVGVKNIAESCLQTGKKLIYVSTDYVFSGESKERYVEESTPNPANYYGWTKYWAEQAASATNKNTLIIRIAVPYGSRSTTKQDVVTRMKEKFGKNEELMATVDQLITPTYIDDIAKAITLLIQKNEEGIVHVVGSSSVSPHDLALAIANTFNYDKHLIKVAYMKDFYQGRAPRPQYTALSNNKLRALGLTPLTISEGLEKIKQGL